MEYPDVEKIRKGLMDRVGNGDSPLDVRMSLLNHGLKVCDKAVGVTFPDIQTIANLQFIERVLNG